MKQLLISIVSDQTAPNVQFIKEFRTTDTHYLFITTEGMEKKRCRLWIEGALGIENAPFIRVDEFNPEAIKQSIQARDYAAFDEIIVNATGGTKMMTVAVIDVLRQLPNARIYYVTGKGQSYIQIHPGYVENTFASKLTLNEYLRAYGFTIKEPGPSDISPEYTNSLFEKYLDGAMEGKDDVMMYLLEQRRNIRDKKCIDISEREQVKELLTNIGFPLQQDGKLTRNELCYLTGGWLECYVANKIKEELGLDEGEIMQGVKLSKNVPDKAEQSIVELLGKVRQPLRNDNEFDVIFLYEGKVYVVECKTSIFTTSHEKQDENFVEKTLSILSDTIYKVEALRNNFGLFAKSSIVTLTDFKSNPDKSGHLETNIRRASLSNIRIIAREQLTSGRKMIDMLR